MPVELPVEMSSLEQSRAGMFSNGGIGGAGGFLPSLQAFTLIWFDGFFTCSVSQFHLVSQNANFRVGWAPPYSNTILRYMVFSRGEAPLHQTRIVVDMCSVPCMMFWTQRENLLLK